MGIERFFSSISNKFNAVQNITYPYEKKLSTHIFIDFNSIIHVVSSSLKNPSDFNVIDKVEEYILNLLTNNFYNDEIKFIMIAIDGVPSKAKMIEQKKRRYIGQLISFMTENNKKWSKNNISPGTYFMHILSNHLNSVSFKNKIKKVCNNIDNILISDIYKSEEGEKKIVNKINAMSFNKNDKIIIYSPDSDVILLALILKKNIDINIYRHDQQKSIEKNYVFNLIEITFLKNIIVNYIKDNLYHNNIKDQELINDIVLIFTIFGDDFLPKIKSYDVKNDINIIFEFYSLTLLIVKKPLIYDNQINFEFFTKLLEVMSKFEETILNENKLEKKYNNYKSYSSNLFFKKLDDLQKSLKDNNNIDLDYNFIFKLLNFIDKKKIYNSLNRKHQYYHFYFYFLDKENLIEELKNYCILKNNYILPLKNIKSQKPKNFNINLKENSNSSKDKYHQNKIKDFTKEKKNEYILMNKLDQYYYKFNVKDGIKDNQNIDNKLIFEYLKGVNWIFEYYFQDNMNNKYWYYPYEKTPLINDIYKYLTSDKKKLKFSYDKVVDQNDFFTVLEQLLFITPINYNFELLNKILNSEQINKIKLFISSEKYKKFYFNLENISKEILFDKKNSHIDCYDALYISKCNLVELNNHYDKQNNFIQDFRKYISFQEQRNIYTKSYQRILK